MLNGLLGSDAQNGGRRRTYRARKTQSKRSRSSRRRRGGSQALATAAVPLTLLGLQKFFQSSKGRSDLKAVDRGVRRTVRRGRRSLRRSL
jgi:hypothetical protein